MWNANTLYKWLERDALLISAFSTNDNKSTQIKNCIVYHVQNDGFT